MLGDGGKDHEAIGYMPKREVRTIRVARQVNYFE